ncbi:symporter [Nocardioides sp. Root1257]|uniref:bile acid:sodium symporter family protein n=1 Tax=unclassified Nocardioides TaxID=2615069 RepID=UPI0006F1E2D6|nr:MULTISPECIES: bile acid:sodium symporter [unclassified Nocardioides]KQW49256.1 symporter [Nocardioides sp. Root1257]KRC48430.1 symporter [Nocardioides sp. Root224]
MLLPLVTALTTDIDHISIDFSSGAQTVLKIVIATILFGIALDIEISDFTAVVRRPFPILVGIVAQFLLLPALTLLLTIVLDVRGSIALGMILVACCPPGNVSNILTHRAGGDVALSVSMTAISNLLTIVMLPINFAFWAGLSPAGDDLLRDVDLDPVKTFVEIALVIGLPFVAGVTINRLWPRFAHRAHKIVGPVSFVLLLLIIVLAFIGNWDIFTNYITLVLLAVFIQHLMALGLGYGVARATGLPSRSRKAMTFEVSVRNTGLGLVLVFAYFDGLGGMALVAAWWGLYDILAGLVVAGLWKRRTAEVVAA